MRIKRFMIKARRLLMLAAGHAKFVAGKAAFMRTAPEIRSLAHSQKHGKQMPEALPPANAHICYLPPNPPFQRTAFGGR